jgi:hypothetical protein
MYNYSFGIAALMFALGLWLRWSGAWTLPRSLFWLSLLMLLATMHPAPIGFLGLFIVSQLAANFRLAYSSAAPMGAAKALGAWRSVRGDLAHAVLLMAPVTWIGIFMLSKTGKPATAFSFSTEWLSRIRSLILMEPLSPYLTSGYGFCLLLMVLLPAALTFLWSSRKPVSPKAASARFSLLITAGACLAVYAYSPSAFLDAGYFAYRMALPAVICFVAAQAGLSIPVIRQRTVAAFAAGVFLLLLAVRDRETAKMTANLAPVYEASLTHQGSAGALISGPEPVFGLTFNPYYWAGADYARRSKAVLFNQLWIDSPLALLGRNSAHAWDNAGPGQIREILSRNAGELASHISFVCGGKLAASSAELESSNTLARTLGLVRVFDSDIYYCYAKPDTDTAALQGFPGPI